MSKILMFQDKKKTHVSTALNEFRILFLVKNLPAVC